MWQGEGVDGEVRITARLQIAENRLCSPGVTFVCKVQNWRPIARRRDDGGGAAVTTSAVLQWVRHHAGHVGATNARSQPHTSRSRSSDSHGRLV